MRQHTSRRARDAPLSDLRRLLRNRGHVRRSVPPDVAGDASRRIGADDDARRHREVRTVTSPGGFGPGEAWSSPNGLDLLQRLADRPVDVDDVLAPLPAWESAILRRALRAPEGFASRSIGARERKKKRGYLAAVLDDYRERERASPPLAKSQPGFRGVRAHLD